MNIRNFIIVTLISIFSSCRNEPSGFDLRKNSENQIILSGEACYQVSNYQKVDFNYLKNSDQEEYLNYVKTLLCTWQHTHNFNDSLPPGLLLQALAFVGDIQSINSLSAKFLYPFPELNDTGYISHFRKENKQFFNARQFIIDSFRTADIIMFNEGHDRPQTRAFVVSILEDLKRLGAVNLAMETLSEKGNLQSLDCTTGYYTIEPSAGEIVREALRLGYKLIPYEDQDRSDSAHSFNQRDSVQARNLYNRIRQGTGIGKTVVLAGYSHIAESYDSTFSTMAMNFKKISGIDPLTVDQVDLIENNPRSPFANRLLGKITEGDSVLAFRANDLKFIKLNPHAYKMYDIWIYHPQTSYSHGRPNWLLHSDNKKFIGIRLPAGIKPVFVQAYLASEIVTGKDYKFKVPVDQTFYAENDTVWLALRIGENYKIVFRDSQNGIIQQETVRPEK